LSEKLLTNLMHFALRVTGAERGMALDSTSQVVALVGLTEDELASPEFTGFDNIVKALSLGSRPFLTNNMILDPSDAPITNTMFTDLRLVVVFPFDQLGAIYIDQPIRDGVLQQDMLDQIQHFARTWLEREPEELSVDDMVASFGS
jgi:hypothetical protein